ncbi:unnamed protein product [Rhizoctonia solani]|uniref:Uncharacterized protein n=1 Tax=Rhizoctonia solani TaxID=456999 RepID=A0A8H3H9B6_9AGAM|nr:unnamed protein product [Rhizoctonia solani]
MPGLNIFLWIKYLGIIIQVSTPDYLFNDFVSCGLIFYGSLQISEPVDFESDFDDLALDLIHIPIQNWINSVELGWNWVRFYLEMEYEGLVIDVFHRGRGAFVSWMYRDILLLPDESRALDLVRTHRLPAMRPGHSIYIPPHSTNPLVTDRRIEWIEPEEQKLDKIESGVARGQTTEAEQDAEQKLKRRTRRGGKKYHERKQRKLERMSTRGNFECGDEETPED